MVNYRTQIKKAASSFELSCIWEDVRMHIGTKRLSPEKCMTKEQLKL